MDTTELDTDTGYLIDELRAALDETERNLREGNAPLYRGDAAEIKRRATELSRKLDRIGQEDREADNRRRGRVAPGATYEELRDPEPDWH